MDHPFLNAGELTDDELMDRIAKCQRILGGEMSMGHTSVVDSAQQALEHYRFEYNERMLTAALENKFTKLGPDGEVTGTDVLEFGIVDELYKPDDKE